jgi:hypothetical protein
MLFGSKIFILSSNPHDGGTPIIRLRFYLFNIFLYMFFWVFPRLQIVVCRRFGTLCQVHLQSLDVEYEHFILYIQPLKMELTEGSETSAQHNLTPGKYPKEHIQYSKHGETLKSRIIYSYLTSITGESFRSPTKRERDILFATGAQVAAIITLSINILKIRWKTNRN